MLTSRVLAVFLKQSDAASPWSCWLTACRAQLTEQDVEDAIQRRAEARKNKDFGAADGVRDELAAKGLAIMDLPGGTTWRPIVAQNES